MNIDIALLTDSAVKLLTAIQMNPLAGLLAFAAFALWLHWSRK